MRLTFDGSPPDKIVLGGETWTRTRGEWYESSSGDTATLRELEDLAG